LKFERLKRYYYLRLMRLREEPHELALGTALGIFSAMLPIMPFHMALAIGLAIFFRASKITAAVGCWFCNPLNWYILYFMNYKIGAFVLRLSEDNKGLYAAMRTIRDSHGKWELISRITSSSSHILGAFIVGGLIMGAVAAIPTYFIFLKLFNLFAVWRIKHKEHKHWWNRKSRNIRKP
jgi:uncharacterized protein (DUF2062 family)